MPTKNEKTKLMRQWNALPSANFDKWSKSDLWSLQEFAYLLKNKEPTSELWPFDFKDFDSHYKELEKQAIRSEKVNNLSPINRYWDGDMPITREYRPCALIKWAVSHGYEIPEGLKHIISQPCDDYIQGKWEYKHDTKMMRIVREVVEEYWEGVDPKNAKSRKEILLTLKEKYPDISQGEAEAIDLITRHDKLRKSKLRIT